MLTGSDKRQNYIQDRNESRGACDARVPFYSIMKFILSIEQSRSSLIGVATLC